MNQPDDSGRTGAAGLSIRRLQAGTRRRTTGSPSLALVVSSGLQKHGFRQ